MNFWMKYCPNNLLPLAGCDIAACPANPIAGLAAYFAAFSRNDPPEFPKAVNDQDVGDIQDSLNNDDEAYARIVRRYQNQIASYMFRFSRQQEECEELVQEVFVEAYFSLHSFKKKSPFFHWLRRIATRVGYRFWKSRARDRARSAITPQEWGQLQAAADQRLAAQEAGELLHKFLMQLPPRDRLVLTLMYIEEQSVEKIASLVGWSQNMVKVQLHRARGKLKKLLDHQESK